MSEQRVEGRAVASPASGTAVQPTANGAPHAAPTQLPQAPAKRSPVRRAVFLLLLLAAIVGSGVVGYRWYADSITYVLTDNAQISGRLVQVGSLAAGRVAAVNYDVGQRVAREQVVARINVPIPVGLTGSGAPRLEFRQTEDAIVEVTAPVDGVVIARGANPGDTVPAGQPILTLVDPRQLWVNANVEETLIRRVRPGQPVEIHLDALDRSRTGRVVSITPASAATFSLLPQQNLSGNFTKQTQLVPVKIALDDADPRLMIGTSATVRIRTLE